MALVPWSCPMAPSQLHPHPAQTSWAEYEAERVQHRVNVRICSPTRAALGGLSGATCRTLVPDGDFGLRRAACSQLTFPRQVHLSSPELCQLISRCCPVPRGWRGRQTNGPSYRWLAEPSPHSQFLRQARCSGALWAGDTCETGAVGWEKPARCAVQGWDQ